MIPISIKINPLKEKPRIKAHLWNDSRAISRPSEANSKIMSTNKNASFRIPTTSSEILTTNRPSKRRVGDKCEDKKRKLFKRWIKAKMKLRIIWIKIANIKRFAPYLLINGGRFKALEEKGSLKLFDYKEASMPSNKR